MSQEVPSSKEGHTIVVRVARIEGHCAAGHQVDDKVIFDGQTAQGRVCLDALSSFLPKVFALRYGAEFPWLADKDVDLHVCPDPVNSVVFEIRRLHE